MPVPALLAIGGSIIGGVISDLLSAKGKDEEVAEIKKLQSQLEANTIDINKYLAEVDKWAKSAKVNVAAALNQSYGQAKEQMGDAFMQRRISPVSGFGQQQLTSLEGEKGRRLSEAYLGIEGQALTQKMSLEKWAAGEGKQDIMMQLGLLKAMPQYNSTTGNFLGKLLEGIATAGGTKIGEAILKP